MDVILLILLIVVSFFIALPIVLVDNPIGKILKTQRYLFLQKPFSTIILTLLFVLFGYCIYKVYENNWYRGFLPNEIEISDTVLISVETGIMDGCGVAIFKLTDDSIQLFSEKGLDALKSASHSRARIGYYNAYRSYDEWSKTPLGTKAPKRPENWGHGMYCARQDIKDKLGTAIEKALQEDKSYYTNGIIVFPDLGLVMFSYGD